MIDNLRLVSPVCRGLGFRSCVVEDCRGRREEGVAAHKLRDDSRAGRVRFADRVDRSNSV
jgi:hypothetical protein